MNNSKQFDIAIIGGGLIGMMTAYELLGENLKIAIIDKGELGQESSRAGGGILSALPPWKQSRASANLVKWSRSYYPSLVQEIEQQSNIACDYMPSGMLVMAADLDSDFDAWYHSKPEPIDLHTDLNQFSAVQHLSFTKKHIWIPNVAFIDNVKFIQALKQVLINNSVSIYENAGVDDWLIEGNSVKKLSTAKTDITANQYVLAAGAWSSEKPFEPIPMVKPIRGQMISYALESRLIEHIVLHDKKYCIPRKSGELVIGSTVEDKGFDKTTTQEAKQTLQGFAEWLLPELKQHKPAQHWAGLRPQAENPIIAKHKMIDNLYMNTGHFRNGILQAPAAGRLMRNLLLDETSMIDPSLYFY